MEREEVINIFRKIDGPSNYLRGDFKERYLKNHKDVEIGIEPRLNEANLL